MLRSESLQKLSWHGHQIVYVTFWVPAETLLAWAPNHICYVLSPCRNSAGTGTKSYMFTFWVPAETRLTRAPNHICYVSESVQKLGWHGHQIIYVTFWVPAETRLARAPNRICYVLSPCRNSAGTGTKSYMLRSESLQKLGWHGHQIVYVTFWVPAETRLARAPNRICYVLSPCRNSADTGTKSYMLSSESLQKTRLARAPNRICYVLSPCRNSAGTGTKSYMLRFWVPAENSAGTGTKSYMLRSESLQKLGWHGHQIVYVTFWVPAETRLARAPNRICYVLSPCRNSADTGTKSYMLSSESLQKLGWHGHQIVYVYVLSPCKKLGWHGHQIVYVTFHSGQTNDNE